MGHQRLLGLALLFTSSTGDARFANPCPRHRVCRCWPGTKLASRTGVTRPNRGVCTAFLCSQLLQTGELVSITRSRRPKRERPTRYDSRKVPSITQLRSPRVDRCALYLAHQILTALHPLQLESSAPRADVKVRRHRDVMCHAKSGSALDTRICDGCAAIFHVTMKSWNSAQGEY